LRVDICNERSVLFSYTRILSLVKYCNDSVTPWVVFVSGMSLTFNLSKPFDLQPLSPFTQRFILHQFILSLYGNKDNLTKCWVTINSCKILIPFLPLRLFPSILSSITSQCIPSPHNVCPIPLCFVTNMPDFPAFSNYRFISLGSFTVWYSTSL